MVLILTEHGLVGGLPRSLDGVPVQVKVTGKIYSRHRREDHTKGPGGGDTSPDDPPSSSSDCSATTAKSRPACLGLSTGYLTLLRGPSARV